MSTPNEIGDDFERQVSQVSGGRRVIQSGGGKFYKLDIRDGGNFILSCKASRGSGDSAIRAIRNLWREAVRGARGLQGHGDSAKPAMAFELDNDSLILLRLDDWIALATGEVAGYIAPGKGEERRSASRLSPME
jgi:hypothetical protein